MNYVLTATPSLSAEDLQKVDAALKELSWDRVLPAILILIVGIVVIQVFSHILKKLLNKSSKIEKGLHSFIVTGIKVLLYILVILASLGALGINISAMLVIFGVVTLAISLALQGLLSNIISGVVILITKPFKVSDLVEVDGVFGYVEQINFNYTTLRTLDEKKYLIPNKIISEAKVKNTTIDNHVRLEIDVNVSYDSTEEDVFAALEEAAKSPYVLDHPRHSIVITEYKDFCITYQLRVFVKPRDYINAKNALYQSFRKIFAKHNVTFTYPHVVVHETEK